MGSGEGGVGKGNGLGIHNLIRHLSEWSAQKGSKMLHEHGVGDERNLAKGVIRWIRRRCGDGDGVDGEQPHGVFE